MQIITPPFGENSTEITGAYRATGTTTDNVYFPSSIKIDGDTISLSDCTCVDTDGNHETYWYNVGVEDGTTVEINAASTANVFINGERTDSFEATNNNPIQIIVQKDDAEPLIIVLT